jgi:hypothetical protein
LIGSAKSVIYTNSVSCWTEKRRIGMSGFPPNPNQQQQQRFAPPPGRPGLGGGGGLFAPPPPPGQQQQHQAPSMTQFANGMANLSIQQPPQQQQQQQQQSR